MTKVAYINDSSRTIKTKYNFLHFKCSCSILRHTNHISSAFCENVAFVALYALT